jgi:vitamin B12 transporter
MSLPLIFLTTTTAVQAETAIVVTGSREAVPEVDSAVSSTSFEEEAIETIALPSASDYLRLSPGVSVAVTGPRGTQTQVRVRGGEANHSLLFIDGIRFNDPAAGNEARFELLTADLLSRIEVVRGPQSALWGSEALGGVVAVSSADPFAARGLAALGEYGSLDSGRLFNRYALRSGTIGVTAAVGWQSSDGIDSFGAGGERDGFDSLTASLKAVHRSGPLELGAVGHWVEGESEYDGFDPFTFRRADTLDSTRNRIGAARLWGSAEWDGWSVRAEASYLDSANRNQLAGAPLNSTFGDRLTLGAQLSRRLGRHQLIAAVERQQEGFRARDTAFFGATDQDRERDLTALVGEWRAQWTRVLSTDVAVRHDDFSGFRNSTTFRAALLVRASPSWTLHAVYGEGIAQPTFFDLFGFFPGSFVGNPDLRPEHMRGWEAGARWRSGRIALAATAFSGRLSDEIVDVFDPSTFLSSTENVEWSSRRDGLELSAEYRGSRWLLAANYTYLDAGEQRLSGAALLREVRRPRHGANLIAYGESDRFGWGASLAYVGSRTDTDFDLFPARMVRLGDYLLASLRVAYRILPRLEAYARVENAFGSDYQDVVGFNTPGQTIHAGLRLTVGR